MKPKNEAAQALRKLRDLNPKYGPEWRKKNAQKANKARQEKKKLNNK